MKNKPRCKFCRETAEHFIALPAGKFCTMEHAINYANKKAKQLRAKKTAQDRARIKAKKQDLKPLSTLCSEAQRYVNSMILAADRAAGYKCIATGREPQHAGHYIHAGSKYRISWLRFYHANIHGQHGESNTKQRGDIVNYRAGLIDRYSEQYVSELEDFKLSTDRGEILAPNRDEIAGMVSWCKAMTKIYKSRI